MWRQDEGCRSDVKNLRESCSQRSTRPGVLAQYNALIFWAVGPGPIVRKSWGTICVSVFRSKFWGKVSFRLSPVIYTRVTCSCLLGAYFCMNMVLITLSTFIAVVIIQTHIRGDRKNKVPPWLKRVRSSSFSLSVSLSVCERERERGTHMSYTATLPNVRSPRTRNNGLKLYKAHCNINVRKAFITNRVVDIWNSLHAAVILTIMSLHLNAV